jgi:hypothetical protein
MRPSRGIRAGIGVPQEWRGACQGLDMVITRRSVIFAVMLGCAPVLLHGADRGRVAAGTPHIRATDPWLLTLLAEGAAGSATFRDLMERLGRSDVIVYLRAERCDLPDVAGCLTLLSGTTGVRYVLIRLRPLPFRVQELEILAHELQHAVEIADRPAIVDDDSLLRAYAGIGHVSDAGTRISADTEQAIQVGAQVRREMQLSGELSASASGGRGAPGD